MALNVPVTVKTTEEGENERLDYAVSAMQGYRVNMEDAHSIVLNLDGATGTSFFGVYDGHGGPAVSRYCARHLHIELRRHESFRDNLQIAIERTFLRMDEMMKDRKAGKELSGYGDNEDWEAYRKALHKTRFIPFCQKPAYEGPQNDGCTACVVLIRGNQIIVGNAGDSRCVLSRNDVAIELSNDFKPNIAAERQRIEAAGHVVTLSERGNMYLIDDGIAISRSLGDLRYKDNNDLGPEQQAITAFPEVRIEERTQDDQFLIIACDGIWDCLTSQQAVDFIRIYLNANVGLAFICEALLGHCLSHPKGRDNMSVVLVRFKTPGACLLQRPINQAAAAQAAAEQDAAARAAATAARLLQKADPPPTKTESIPSSPSWDLPGGSKTKSPKSSKSFEYKMPEADHLHENAGEEKCLPAVLPQHEDHESKGNRSPKTEEKLWELHQEKPGLKYGCIDKKLSSDDNLFVSEVIDFVNSPVMEETMGESKTLPVNKFRDDLLKAVQEHKVIIIVDETGSGKTTEVPQYLHEAGYTVKGKIACVQSHPVAALSVAANVSKEMGVNLGDEVGFSLRFEDLSSVGTVIKYMTAGVLLRELIVDPDLSSYSVVMIADATQRNLESDILFGLLEIICLVRPDLKLLIASPSPNVKRLQDHFGSALVFKIHGKQCPVEIYHTKAPVPDYVDAVADTIMQIHMKETAGHILVFLPGEEHAEEVNEILDQKIKGLEKMPYKLIMCPIYANLSVDFVANTLKAATPSDRKVILVNDIAEVSPVIDGIKYVIDTGLCTMKSYNPRLGIEYLLIRPISKASTKERARMSGLTRPQKCYRLYTRDSYIHDLEGCTVPEIQRTNLAHMVLILKTIGINDDLVHFPYLDSPPTEALAKALNQIYALGGLNSRGQLTKTGRRMVEFPLDPLLSKMIVALEKYRCSVEAITIASMLSIGNSVFCCPQNSQDQADLARFNFHTGNVGDHIALLNVYNSWEESGYSTQWCHDNYIQADSMKRAKQIRDLLEKILEKVGIELCSNANDFVSIKKAITSGFFYHAARHHKGGTYRTIKDPQIVYIDPKSGLAEVCPQWVIFHEIVFNTGDHIGQVMEVEPEWLLEIAPHVYKNEDIADSGSKKLLEDG